MSIITSDSRRTNEMDRRRITIRGLRQGVVCCIIGVLAGDKASYVGIRDV
jgi:hypothetical protein